METALSILGPLSPVLYALSFVLYAVYFFKRDGLTERAAKPVLLLAVAEHLAYTIARALTYDHHPMAGVFETLSIVALALALVYVVIETWRKNKTTGMFVLPFVLIVQTVSIVCIEPTREIAEILRDPLFGAHTGTVTLGYAAFFLAAVYGVMYLLFHRALRRKNFGLLFERLTPLDVLARMNRGATLVGFVIISVGVALGMVWASKTAIPDYYLDPRVLLTALFWAVFGFSLLSHYALRWSARRVVWLSLSGFLLMVLTTMAVNLVLPSWHRFGG
jgi:ABC-type uncharacterized transport system permease subunit